MRQRSIAPKRTGGLFLRQEQKPPFALAKIGVALAEHFSIMLQELAQAQLHVESSTIHHVVLQGTRNPPFWQFLILRDIVGKLDDLMKMVEETTSEAVPNASPDLVAVYFQDQTGAIAIYDLILKALTDKTSY